MYMYQYYKLSEIQINLWEKGTLKKIIIQITGMSHLIFLGNQNTFIN